MHNTSYMSLEINRFTMAASRYRLFKQKVKIRSAPGVFRGKIAAILTSNDPMRSREEGLRLNEMILHSRILIKARSKEKSRRQDFKPIITQYFRLSPAVTNQTNNNMQKKLLEKSVAHMGLFL